MTYKVNSTCMNSTFAVPQSIVSNHLRLASGEQIKVLLLILGKAPGKLDEKQIAEMLKLSVSDVEDCLQYWTLMGILEPCEKNSSAPEKYIPSPAPEKEKKPEVKPAVEYSRPSASVIAARMEESAEIRSLFSELQKKLGKTIGYDGQSTFLILHDTFGLPADVIFMLVDYCVSVNKTGFSYIEAAGKDWSEQEIDTIDKAAEKIASLDRVNAMWKKLAAAAGLNNPKPTSLQSKKLEYWINGLNMSFDMIYLAYERMAERTGKLSLAYMEKILIGWYNSKLKTPAEVEASEKVSSDAKKKADSFSGKTSYNLDEHTEKAIKEKLTYKKKGDK
ncbi:MAG: DnaD domain protein [Clostridia bacterium]|nr:DnaD domain protein [Clostridia bacterium]